MYSTLNKGCEMNDSIMDKPATKRDIENLRQELTGKMATKEELKKLATKEEIKKLATKEEIKKLATKEEIKKLATKEEIKKLATKEEIKKLESLTKKEFKRVDKRLDTLSSAVSKLQYQMSFVVTKDEFDKKLDHLLTAIDGLTQKITDSQTEKAAAEHTFQRHERKLEDHEQRIEQLEISV